MSSPRSRPVSNNRPHKRLRLGTKSCRECRRRKIRCIFESQGKQCKECLIHDVECIPQKPADAQAKPAKPDVENQDVQQKIQGLEEMVHRLWRAMDSRAGTRSSLGPEMSAVEALAKLHTTLPSSDISIITSTSDHFDVFEQAPLLGLLEEATLIQKQIPQADIAEVRLSDESYAASCVSAVKALIPSPAALNELLDTTRRYWPVWEKGQGLSLNSGHLQYGDIHSAQKSILDSMKLDSSIDIAKSLLFLALCVQQLPTDFQRTALPASPKGLLISYMKITSIIIFDINTRSVSIDTLECLVMLSKIHVTMGRPREAWEIGRHACTLALLKRLHLNQNIASTREKAV